MFPAVRACHKLEVGHIGERDRNFHEVLLIPLTAAVVLIVHRLDHLLGDFGNAGAGGNDRYLRGTPDADCDLDRDAPSRGVAGLLRVTAAHCVRLR